MFVSITFPLIALAHSTCNTPTYIPVSAIVSAMDNPDSPFPPAVFVDIKPSCKIIVYDIPKEDEYAVKQKMLKALWSIKVSYKKFRL
jgi:hypothetical protein